MGSAPSSSSSAPNSSTIQRICIDQNNGWVRQVPEGPNPNPNIAALLRQRLRGARKKRMGNGEANSAGPSSSSADAIRVLQYKLEQSEQCCIDLRMSIMALEREVQTLEQSNMAKAEQLAWLQSQLQQQQQMMLANKMSTRSLEDGPAGEIVTDAELPHHPTAPSGRPAGSAGGCSRLSTASTRAESAAEHHPRAQAPMFRRARNAQATKLVDLEGICLDEEEEAVANGLGHRRPLRTAIDQKSGISACKTQPPRVSTSAKSRDSGISAH